MTFLESIVYMAWRGAAIGLIISAPMGPVGMLCIQRTLDKGRRAGFYTGVGAAISDLLYSLLTALGLSFIEDFLERNQNIIQLAGSAVLIAFGIYLFRRNPSRGLKKPVEVNISVKKNILGGFLFTFSNPLILFLIIGLFARFNFLLPEFRAPQYLTGFVFIFLGALLWWWFITFSVDKVRSHFNIRSMWLINRIIGVIILLFALVGIFTATSALARGEEMICYNPTRGFGPFAAEEGAVVNNGSRLINDSGDTVTYMVSCKGGNAVEFRSKVRNHHALDRRRPWGFLLKTKDGGRLWIDVRSHETDGDGISSAPALDISVRGEGSLLASEKFSDRTNLLGKLKHGATGPDPTGALNFYRIVISEGRLSFFSGLHTSEHLLAVELPESLEPDSIGVYIGSKGSITLHEARLNIGYPPLLEETWRDPALLDDYLSGSYDFMEGYWQCLDRSLDESLLRLGGDYRYAMVRAEDGYDLLYLSGAKVNPDGWSAGMRKATLRPSGIAGVWSVVWWDAMHQPLSYELKAQADDNGTLTIQFPYQASQLRLHHSSR